MFSFGQNTQNTMQGSNSLGTQSLQTPNFFGTNQNTTPPQNNSLGGGNIFGGGSVTPTNPNGTGIFGGGNTATPSFGLSNNNTMGQPGLFGGTQGNQNQPLTNNTAFGNPTSTTGTGIFSGNSNTGGLFGNLNTTTNNTFKPQPQQSAFGATNSTSILGNNTTTFNTNTTNNNNSIFGQNTGGMMNNTAFNKPTTGAFGTTQNNTFGTNNTMGLFGNNPTNQQNGIFNNTTQNNNTSFFGNTNNNTGGAIFSNNTVKNNNQTPLFGGTSNTAFGTTNTVFGTTNTTGGTIFGNTNTPQGGGGLFGGFNSSKPVTNTMTSTQNTFNFSPNTTPSLTSPSTFGTTFNNNTLGNTTWGVPTNNQTISKFTPLKPRNTKIDGKHVVKCITLLQQNMNYSKNQLRIKYILTGGQPQPNNFMLGNNNTNTTGQLFGNNTNNNTTTWFKNQNPLQNNLTNTIFSGINNNTGGGLFNQPNTQPLFGQQTNTNQSTGIFGNTANTQTNTTGGLFGVNSNTNSFKPTTGGLFGNNNTPSFGGSFGNNTTFGGTQQPSTGLFGTNNNTTGTLFTNSTAHATTAFPSGNANNTNMGGGSLFNSPQTTPLFGASTTPSFGNTSNQQAFQFASNQQSPGFLTTQNQANPNSFMQQGTNYAAPNQGFNDYNNNMINLSMQMAQAQPNQYGPYPPANNPNAALAASFLNGLFNSNFIQKFMDENPNSPFQQLVTQVKKKNIANPFQASDQFGPSLNNDNTNSNKYNKAMFNSPINFNQSRYLYTDSYLPESGISNFTNDELKQKFMNFNQKFQPQPIKFKQTDNILPKNISSPQPSKPLPPQTTHKRNLVTQTDLPILDKNYTIIPALPQLKQKSLQQLKNIQDVIIQNQYGKIHFKQPINLHHKKISQCLDIIQDSIQIIQQQWQKKQCQLYFYNFSHYIDLDNEQQKNKIQKKMKKWIDKNHMRSLNFDKNTGLLHVEIY